VRLRKRDAEALLEPLGRDDVDAVVHALTIALRLCLDEPCGTFAALVTRCGLSPANEASAISHDPPTLWDLATELAERRTFGSGS
jgi:hypothetical protein